MTTHQPSTDTQRQLAHAFRALHVPGQPLALANAWDVATARIAEESGAPAVATTSAGVAWSLGAPDGDVLEREQALELVGRIVAAVRTPVSADVEGGFGTDADTVAETVTKVIAAGAVGINIEDGDRSPAEFAQRLSAARAAADSSGVPLFINVRTDVYLRGLTEPAARLEETFARARAYLEAGADGIFVPGTSDLLTIAELVKGIDAPVNILVGPGSPSVAELASVGVARVSLGSAVAEHAYSMARHAAKELLEQGTYTTLTTSGGYRSLNTLFGG
ncbi:isocitrate lyase/phosphoenolpyruvate mutase family protein [Streptomyces sp. NPDC006879]|uniref:isocitrate lyase/PEP mutase family protein n=1 Tax=Streptomyces sp. NPDC006879 TaxID=3364767 RepID=UPI00369516CC